MRKRPLAILMMVIMIMSMATMELFAYSNMNMFAAVSRPANVTGFQSVPSYRSVVLRWNKVSGADGYLIKWKVSGGKLYNIRVSGGNTTRYRHAVPEGKHYSYSIVAVKSTAKNHYGPYYDKNKVKRIAYATTRSAKYVSIGGEAVRLMKNQIIFGEGKTLTSHTGGYVDHYFPYGYKTLTTGYDNGRYEFWYGGRQYMVSRVRISDAAVYYLKPSYTYSRASAESFVNTAKITSSTSKLVWVNQYTQKLYVFKNVSGIWNCIAGPWDVSSGAPESPTDTGRTYIHQKDSYHNNLPYWSVCDVFSLHGKYSYWELGWPRSNGCCRNYNSNAEYIYDNCPVYSEVLVY